MYMVCCINMILNSTANIFVALKLQYDDHRCVCMIFNQIKAIWNSIVANVILLFFRCGIQKWIRLNNLHFAQSSAECWILERLTDQWLINFFPPQNMQLQIFITIYYDTSRPMSFEFEPHQQLYMPLPAKGAANILSF